MHEEDRFLAGVFSAMQIMVLEHDETSIAKFVAQAHCIKQEWALRESEMTGYGVRKMNEFIRNELPK